MGRCHTNDTKQKILKIPRPETKKDNKSFLSLVRFMTDSVFDLSSKLYQLQRLEKKEIPWQWGIEEQKCFEDIKTSIEHTGILCHPNDDGRMILWTDTSDFICCISRTISTRDK